MENQKVSPIKQKPLRLPGQSIDEQIDELLEGKAMMYIFVTVFVVVLAIMEWFRWYREIPYTPKIYTAVAIAIASFSLYKCIKIFRKVINLKQGREGERHVGQSLEKLEKRGYRVLHDIKTGKGNIDHVIICDRGVFAIETKNYSMSISGESSVTVNDERIKIDGYNNEDIAKQAKGEAKWLSDLFQEPLKKRIFVFPVVVFPGWTIRYPSRMNEKFLVCNENSLSKHIENKPKKISKDDVNRLITFLENYTRENH